MLNMDLHVRISDISGRLDKLVYRLSPDSLNDSVDHVKYRQTMRNDALSHIEARVQAVQDNIQVSQGEQAFK